MGVQIQGDTGNVIATKGTFSGDVGIAGTLTYEDVTNIDSVGLVTARTGIEIGARPGVAASISVDGNMIVSGISTFGGDVQVSDKIIHSGDTDTAIRFPSADTFTVETGGSERLRITDNGLKVGTTVDNNYAVIHAHSSGTAARLHLTNANTGTTISDGAIIMIDSSSNMEILNKENTNLEFFTNNTERLRIKSDGIIVAGNSGTSFGNALIQSFIAHGNTAGESAFSAVDTTSVAAGVGGEIAFHGKYNTGAQDYAYLGHIRGIKENATAGNTACALTFHTRPNATAPQERLRLTSDGYLLIGGHTEKNLGQGNTTTGVGLNPLGRLNASRDGAASILLNRNNSDGPIQVFYREGVQEGNISITTSAVAYNTSSSDRTLKKNFEDWTENTLDLFKNINPQKFNFIHQEDSEDKIKGYIAQDLVDSFPEAYPKDDDGKYHFNPSGMVVYLMKALQEATIKIETLESKVAALEG